MPDPMPELGPQLGSTPGQPRPTSARVMADVGPRCLAHIWRRTRAPIFAGNDPDLNENDPNSDDPLPSSAELRQSRPTRSVEVYPQKWTDLAHPRQNLVEVGPSSAGIGTNFAEFGRSAAPSLWPSSGTKFGRHWDPDQIWVFPGQSWSSLVEFAAVLIEVASERANVAGSGPILADIGLSSVEIGQVWVDSRPALVDSRMLAKCGQNFGPESAKFDRFRPTSPAVRATSTKFGPTKEKTGCIPRSCTQDRTLTFTPA